MSKQKKIARKDAPKELIAQVQEVIAMADKNRYSVSRIFAAHNAVFGLNDTPQSCTSCLTTRTAALRTWYGVEADTTEQDEAAAAAYLAAQDAAAVNVEHNPKTGNALVSEAAAAIGAQGGDPDKIQNEVHPHYNAVGEGVTRYDMPEGIAPLDFTPSAGNALKGTILHADGSNVKAGTYTTADGTTIAVSVGNKATIKDDLI